MDFQHINISMEAIKRYRIERACFVPWTVAVMLVLCAWRPSHGWAQPLPKTDETGWRPIVDYRSANANRSKVGFDTYTTSDPPRKYLTETIEEAAFNYTYATWTITGSGGANYWSVYSACDGDFQFHSDLTWTSGNPATGNHRTGTSLNWSSLGNPPWHGSTSGTGSESGTSYGVSVFKKPGFYVSAPSASGTAHVVFSPGAVGTRTETYPTNGGMTSVTGSLVLAGISGTPHSVTETEKVLTNSTDYTTAQQVHTLSAEFSTGLLKSLTSADLGGESFGSWSTTYDTASFDLSSDEQDLTLQKLSYRFRFTSEPDMAYKVTWQEITYYEKYGTGEQPLVIPKELYIPAGEGGLVITDEFVAEPPSRNGSTFVSSVRVKAVGEKDPCGDSCQHCGEGGPGPMLPDDLSVSFGMGDAAFGKAHGSLMIEASETSTGLSQPGALFFSGSSEHFEVIESGGHIAQVRGEHSLAHVHVESDFKYSLHFYPSNGIGSKVGDLYATNGEPFLTWTIENPDASTNAFDTLRLIESRDGRNVTNEYVYTKASREWSLTRGNGLTRITRSDSTSNAFTNRTETVEIRNPATSDLLSKTLRKYELMEWGEELVEIVEDPDGLNRVTTIDYDDGFPVRIDRPDGSWVTYQYSLGRLNYERSAYLNSTNGTIREFSYSYDLSGAGGDDTNYYPNVPRLSKEHLPTRYIYNVFQPGEHHQYLNSIPGFSTSLPSIKTVVHTNGLYAGKPISITYPNGTMQLFDYGTNSAGTLQTNIVSQGAPNGTGTSITNGTQFVSVVDGSGAEISRQVFDVASGLLTDSTMTAYDERNRPISVTYLDGTSMGYSYECCGIGAVTNRDGSVVTYEYDDLKRPIAEHRYLDGSHTVSTIRTYDAADRLLSVTRIGTNGNAIVLASFAYDMLGRVAAETNALDVVTTHAYSGPDTDGQNTVTLTFADGTADAGQRIERYYRDGYLESVTGSATFPKRFHHGYDGSSGGFQTVEYSLDAAGNDTVQNRSVSINQFHKVIGTVETYDYRDNLKQLTRIFYYDSVGRLYKFQEQNGVLTLLTNDTSGRLEYSVLDMNRNSLMEFAGTDRITRHIHDVVENYGTTVLRTRTYVWPTNNADVSVVARTVEASADGNSLWTTEWGQTSRMDVAWVGGGYRYVTNRAPDQTVTLEAYEHGRLVSTTRFDTNGVQVAQTTYGYDVHDRLSSETDARNGTTSYTYNDLDQVVSTTTPDPGAGGSPQTTSYEYDARGRLAIMSLPDGSGVTNEYYPNDLIKATYGSQTYPVEYVYDVQGRLRTNTTWQNYATGEGATYTVYNYNAYSGFLTNKNDGNGAGYHLVYNTYNGQAWGHVGERRSARQTTATYNYNWAGELSTVAYSGSPATAALTYTYDRLGRLSAVAQGALTTTLGYNEVNRMVSESYSGGTLDGWSVHLGYDGYQRQNQRAVKDGGSPEFQHDWEYDSAGRLGRVYETGATEHSVDYGYHANSSLLASVDHRKDSTSVLTVHKIFDYLNRLTSTVSSNAAGGVWFSQAYGYNELNQRTSRSMEDGSYWNYDYDLRGQVTTAHRHWSDGSKVAGQQFGYSFSDNGNRTGTSVGGDQWGSNLRYASYQPNTLYQYSQRDVPPAVDVLGSATNTSVVTVNDQATEREGEYFRAEVAVDNSSTAVWLSLTNLAVLNQGASEDIVATNQGNLFIPQQPQAFLYDADGNLTNDGHWQYIWDLEDRLVQMETLPTVPSGAEKKLVFSYDYRGRRIKKSVYDWGGSWSLTYERRFLYDDWNLLCELDSSDDLVREYLWGPDLSGTMDGAGGIGGLFKVYDHGSEEHYFPAYDGHGNAIGLIRASDGELEETYEYGPFGEILRLSAAASAKLPFHFSTKYHDAESDLHYYAYRFYSSDQGRWLNRDPIGEIGGLNIYAYVQNAPVDNLDALGLASYFEGDSGRYHVNIERDRGLVKGRAYAVQLDSKGKLTFGPIGEHPFPGVEKAQQHFAETYKPGSNNYKEMRKKLHRDYASAIGKNKYYINPGDKTKQKLSERIADYGRATRKGKIAQLAKTSSLIALVLAPLAAEASAESIVCYLKGFAEDTLNGDDDWALVNAYYVRHELNQHGFLSGDIAMRSIYRWKWD